MLASIDWNISPEIFSIGPVHIRWYGLLFALSFVIGYQIMARIFLNEGKKQKDLESLTIWMIIGTVVGARLGHCLFYDPMYYLNNPLEIIKIWHGGLASHGAAIVNLIVLYFYSKKRPNISFLWILDRIVIVVALAGCFIRLGNFFNSEILGTPSDLPWAMVFASYDNVPRHPVQLYESLSYLIIFIFLMLRYRALKRNVPSGQFFGLFLVLVFGARFILEFFKLKQEAFAPDMALNMGHILSIPFILIGLYFIWYSRKKG